MTKRYNILTRCLAAVALLFVYVASTSAILVGATTSSAQAAAGVAAADGAMAVAMATTAVTSVPVAGGPRVVFAFAGGNNQAADTSDIEDIDRVRRFRRT
jgi:hypothetical protein